jgi:hypothetical protein
MGDLKQADAVETRWPNGHIDRTANVAVKNFCLAREGDSLRPDPRVAPKKASSP